jgi:hypothetical protein
VRRRGRTRKQILSDLKEKRRYWKLKEKALALTLGRTRFGRRYGPVLRLPAQTMNILSFVSNVSIPEMLNREKENFILIKHIAVMVCYHL